MSLMTLSAMMKLMTLYCASLATIDARSTAPVKAARSTVTVHWKSFGMTRR